MNKYLNMNEILIGTKVKIRNKDLVGKIIEIFHFPTTFSLTSKRYVYDNESTTYTAFRIIDRLDNNNITFRY